MTLPTYHKKIEVVVQERDFYGFVEEEGEAYIEGQNVVTNIRFNDRMTGEIGEYNRQEYPILEYFADVKLLKVTTRPHIASIFRMDTGEITFSGEYIRLLKDGYDAANAELVGTGLSYLAHHLVYLYKIEPQASMELLPSILQLPENQELALGELRIYKEYGSWYIHQLHNPFLMQVLVHQNGILFSYPYISYYFAGLKKYLAESLKDSDWRIV